MIGVSTIRAFDPEVFIIGQAYSVVNTSSKQDRRCVLLDMSPRILSFKYVGRVGMQIGTMMFDMTISLEDYESGSVRIYELVQAPLTAHPDMS
jgi:hypothetical protein